YEAELDNNKVNLDSTLEGLHINESAHIVSNTCTSKLNFSSPKLSSDGLSAELAGVCEYEADKSLLNLNLAGSLNEAPLKLAVKIFTGQNKPYAVVAGAIDSLDLSRLEVNKYKLLPLYYDDGLLPFSWLSLININADLAIKHFSLDRINLDNVSTKFSVANDKLTVDKVQADVYNGVLSGSGQITKVDNNYTIATKQTIKNLDLQSMFNDLFNVQAISGKANLNMNVLVKDAASYEDLHKRLNGQVVIDANHGEFQGIDLNLFVNPKDSMSLTTDKSTMFEQLKAKFNFENGISKNSSLNFSSPYVIATGNGLLDFLNTKLDYTMTIKSALPHNEQKISSVVIPVSISGDLFGPKVSIQNIHLFTKHSEVAKTPLKLKHSLHGIRKNKPHKPSKVVKMGKPHHNSRPITRG
ncbi:MAG: AsmA-like C-terminal region-containing protein, partial [Burkholderiales bacterium]